MRGYELCLLLHADTTEEDISKLLDSLTGVINTHEGNVLETETWGKKTFRYPIKKQNKGYYHFVYFNGTPATLREIDRMIRYNERVLRFTTMHLPKSYTPPAEAAAQEPAADVSETPAAEEPKAETQEQHPAEEHAE